MARADRERIYNVLKDFRGLESLKKLFWQELNYDRANAPLSRQSWPPSRTSLLAEDPLLFATAGSADDFHLIYCRFAADRLSLADERELINRLHQDHPYALYIFSDRQQRQWHLVNVKQDSKQRGQMLFRRIALGPSEQVRTASERVAMLDAESVQPSGPQQQSRFKSGVSALAIQHAAPYGERLALAVATACSSASSSKGLGTSTAACWVMSWTWASGSVRP